jgi:hypothetical protein
MNPNAITAEVYYPLAAWWRLRNAVIIHQR